VVRVSAGLRQAESAWSGRLDLSQASVAPGVAPEATCILLSTSQEKRKPRICEAFFL
jgi:hypothetical protein